MELKVKPPEPPEKRLEALNPFNGIESVKYSLRSSFMAFLNPFNGIESLDLVRLVRLDPARSNPFNGIERASTMLLTYSTQSL